MRPFDISGAFRPDAKDVRRLAVQGAGVTVFSSGLGVGLQIIATMVLARLLTPQDFGVVAMVTTFSLLFVNFGLNGFTEAVVQRPEIDQFLVSNLFWINIGAGVLLTIGFAAAGSLMARFYGDPLVTRVALATAPSIFIASLSVLHLGLLKRAMRYPALAANDVISRIVSVVVSILAALAGWGYWALVAGIIAQPLSQSMGAFYLCRWIPSLTRRAAGTGSMVRFAMSVYGRFTLNYSTRNMDNLLVGWRFSEQALGFYKKAYDLFALSAGQLTAPLAIVAVSGLSRFDPRSKQYREQLLNAVSVMSLLGMALAVNLTLIGKDLIRVLLGPAWAPSGQIFTFFGPGVGIMVIYYIHGWIHLSIGRADRWFRWGLVEFAFTGLLFIVGLHWGPAGVAAAWTASFWILTIPAFWYAGKPIGLPASASISRVWRYLIAALLAGGASVLIIRVFPYVFGFSGTAGALARILIVSILFGALYLGAVVLLHGGFSPIRQLEGLVKEMISLRANSSPSIAVQLARTMGDSGGTNTQEGKSKPLVSILIPAYNAQEWIADTLRSAIAQTWNPKEIIVVDDGSTDQTVAVARRFECDGIRVVTQQNQGASAARNKAFSLSRGEYIQWLDADDLLAPDKVARQMEWLLQSPSKQILLSSGFGRFRYRFHRAKFISTALWCDLTPVEWLLRKLGQNAGMQVATWLTSRELTEAAGPWDTRLLGDDDGEYFCRVLMASEGVRFVPNANVYYRSASADSLSYIGRSNRKLEAHWLSMRLHIGYLRSLEDSERTRDACLRYLHTGLVNFYPERLDIVDQMRRIAAELGRELAPPRLRWKYSWTVPFLGWRQAKRLETVLPRFRWRVEKSWDKMLFRFERPRLEDRTIDRMTCPPEE